MKRLVSAFALCLSVVLLSSCTLNKETVDKVKDAVVEKAVSVAGFEEGTVITFGKAESDGNYSNGPENLEWIVLKVEQIDGKAYATLLSKEIVGCPDGWNKISGNTLYSRSNLHDWCETDFFNQLVTSNDQSLVEKIMKVEVKTGKDTVQAHVYAPSKAELEKYLAAGNRARYLATNATKAAKAEGAISNAYYVREAGVKEDGIQWAAGYDKDGKFHDGFIADSGAVGARVCITIFLGEFDLDVNIKIDKEQVENAKEEVKDILNR
ncbi:MAG: hypothetical protein E7580_07600 [Ruminococcaceae bacterium]|nr:hypothetical protein [Oscillospiraceae bacterium]